MNRYERQNAALKIDGYYFPPSKSDHLHRTVEQRFSEAKAECLKHLESALNDVKEMTFDEFLAGRRGK